MHVYFDRRFHEKKLASDAHSKTYLTLKKWRNIISWWLFMQIIDCIIDYIVYIYIYMSYKDGDTGG